MYDLGQYLSAHKDANTLTTKATAAETLIVLSSEHFKRKDLNKLPSKRPRMRRSRPVLWEVVQRRPERLSPRKSISSPPRGRGVVVNFLIVLAASARPPL
jgi:hypothetical protein